MILTIDINILNEKNIRLYIHICMYILFEFIAFNSLIGIEFLIVIHFNLMDNKDKNT